MEKTIRTKLSLGFGALVPKLSVQLKGLGVSRESCDRFQKIADAITMIAVHDIMPESVVQRARRKLAKRIAGALGETYKMIADKLTPGGQE